jgi:predicted membrane channel-forming protein YqfA (hemolysin III family)
MLYFLTLAVVCVVASVMFWTVPRSGRDIVSAIYLLLAFFWLISAVHGFFFWDLITQHMRMPVNRETAVLILTALFAYNVARWRLSRRPPDESKEEPRRLRPPPTYDPDLDFTKDDEGKR